MKIRLGTRGSPLALAQTASVANALATHGFDCQIIPIKTTGDRITQCSLQDIGGKALFTKEIQHALLKDEIDLGVHSLKDMEVHHPDGLTLLGVLEPEHRGDTLVMRKGFSVTDVKTVGTGSPRRTAFIQDLYPFMQPLPLRGNVGTRLQKVSEGQMDAVILSTAGLIRLKLHEEPRFSYHQLDPFQFPKSAGQGVIAIEGKPSWSPVIQKINHEQTFLITMLERQIVRDFGGDCHSVIGLSITLEGKMTHLYIKFQNPKKQRLTIQEEYVSVDALLYGHYNPFQSRL